MGKLILRMSMSLDGLIARKNGDSSWLDPFNSVGENFDYKTFYAGVGTIIVGKNAYRQALKAGSWPTHDRLTYILTHEKLDIGYDALILPYDGELNTLIAEIKSKYSKHIWLMGGAITAQEFLKAGLVEEIMLNVVPLILGDGISLFGSIKHSLRFKHNASKAYPNGITLLHYTR